jgi:hypothetical protein
MLVLKYVHAMNSIDKNYCMSRECRSWYLWTIADFQFKYYFLISSCCLAEHPELILELYVYCLRNFRKWYQRNKISYTLNTRRLTSSELCTSINNCVASCEAHTNFADESMCLLAENIQNVVTIHRSQKMLKMVTLYIQTFLALAEEVLIYPSKLFCRNTCNFPTNIFF